MLTVVALLSCSRLVLADTVVRREYSHHVGTSVFSNKVYEHEVLHEGTVHRIREAMKQSKDPVEVAHKMVAEYPPSLQAIARHEVDLLAQDELASRGREEARKPQELAKSMLQKKAAAEYEASFPIIHSGALVTLRDKGGSGYITASADCSDTGQPACGTGEHTGCVRLSGANADHIEINQVGGTHSDNAIQFTGEVSLKSQTLTSNSTHGYYLGICKTSHEHESNGQLYWFHQAHNHLVMSNVLFTISWEDPAESGLELRSKMEVALHSPVAHGYLLADSAGNAGQERLEEKYFDIALHKDLADKARWIIELEAHPAE
jgi:hypothetical protein